ncbi:P4 family phage/plasmid primase-like protein [Phycicoccus badiiscoriae]|uniref:P4 family phage/plasmid primase-like protein n=1 Tax=Pedococcus badiiscoriae TaxID=642776 RepID=A0A852WHI7_9MICO|nr:P4 family phage/plasmid primase-like protein [Pedococcus badiiscoriae]
MREHLFPVLIGSGANGKGTAYGAMTSALGDYATVINPDMLMVRDRGGIGGPEMMTLLGARLVIGSETEDGRKLDEATMKRLTGGDELTARQLYREPVTWQPTHQLLYVTNALPKVKGNDPAVWRRIRVVPFGVVVPVEDRDPALPERLALHADAVLSWVICGYFDYEDNGGMREPSSVLHATGAYRADSDAVARFVDERCFTSPVAQASTRDLYGAWQRWALEDAAEPMSEKAFARELDRLGYEATKTRIGMRRKGLSVLDEDAATGGGEGW